MQKNQGSQAIVWLGAVFTLIAIVALVSIILIRSRAETQTTQEASAGNAAPAIDTLQALDDVDGTDVTQAGVGFSPNEGTTHSLRVTGTISDANGCPNTDNVSVAVYRSGLDQSGSWTPNANDLPVVFSSSTTRNEGNYFILGDRLYSANKDTNRFEIYDISDESSPRLVSSIGTDTYPKDVVVSGNSAFVVTGWNGKLQAIDISDEVHPVIRQTLQTVTNTYAVNLYGNYLFVGGQGDGSGTDELRVYDITSPYSMTQVKAISVPTMHLAYDMEIQGNYLYVAMYYASKLYIYDITDPTNPILTGQVSGMTGDVNSVAVKGNYAYVSSLAYLNVVDVTDKANPVKVRTITYPYSYNRIAIHGNYLYVGDTAILRVYGLTDPSNPALLGTTSGFSFRIYVTAITDTHAFIGSLNNIKVLDLAALVPPPTIACDDSLLDDNECYTAQTMSFTNCSGAGDTTANFLMTIPVKNFADPTDTGSHSSENWVVKAKVVDAVDASSTDQITFEMNSLAGFSIVPEALDYGSLTIGELSAAQGITLTNTGNTGVNANIKADHDMTSSLPGFSDIPSTNVHYSLSSGMNFATSTGVTTSDVLFTLGLAQQTVDTDPAPSVPAYFMLQVPSSGVYGTYSNTLTLTARVQ